MPTSSGQEGISPLNKKGRGNDKQSISKPKSSLPRTVERRRRPVPNSNRPPQHQHQQQQSLPSSALNAAMQGHSSYAAKRRAPIVATPQQLNYAGGQLTQQQQQQQQLYYQQQLSMQQNQALAHQQYPRHPQQQPSHPQQQPPFVFKAASAAAHQHQQNAPHHTSSRKSSLPRPPTSTAMKPPPPPPPSTVRKVALSSNSRSKHSAVAMPTNNNIRLFTDKCGKQVTVDELVLLVLSRSADIPSTAPPYIPPESGCCAGEYCQEPNNLPVEGSSIHRCMNCNGLLHSRLFCGKLLSEIGCQDVNLLSPYGHYKSVTVSAGNMLVCHMCIARYQMLLKATMSMKQPPRRNPPSSPSLPPPPPPLPPASKQQRSKPSGLDEFGEEEELALDMNNVSAKRHYERLQDETKKLPMLLAMQVGMDSDSVEKNNRRINELTENKKVALGKRESKYTGDTLRAEIKRRHDTEKETNDAFNTKMPSTSGNNTSLVNILTNTYPPKRSDEIWVLAAITSFLDRVEGTSKQKESEKQQNAQHITTNTRIRMRLFHAWLDDTNRDTLVKQFDSMTRSQLDSRNSADRDLTIFERTVHLYNNPNWKPTSFAFPDLHEKFNIPMNLSLPEDADQLTPENAKKQLCDLLSQYKKSDANWRQSGNGKGNKATSGQRVRVRLTGTQYTADPIQGASDEDPVEEYSDEDDTVEIQFVNDDRWDFCNSNLALAYLFGLLEEFRLGVFAVQNIERIALVGGKPASARTPGLPTTTPRGASSTTRRGRKDTIDQTINTHMEGLRNMFSEMNTSRSGKNVLIQYEEQLRKASVHYSDM